MRLYKFQKLRDRTLLIDTFASRKTMLRQLSRDPFASRYLAVPFAASMPFFHSRSATMVSSMWRLSVSSSMTCTRS